MPLKRGYAPSVISFNIRRLMGEGYNRMQATAIAMKEASKSKRAEADQMRRLKAKDQQRRLGRKANHD